MIVLDTNVVSEALKSIRHPAFQRWYTALDVSLLYVTATTVAELMFGVERLPNGRRKRDLKVAMEQLLAQIPNETLPFDDGAARAYAQLAAQRESMGRVIGLADGQIAAICRHRGMTLATRNVRDFASTGIDLVNPWAAA